MKKTPQKAMKLYSSGKAKEAAHKYEEAIQYYNKAIIIDPTFSDAYNSRGFIKLKLNLREEALKDFDEAIRSGLEDTITYYNRGLCKMLLGKYGEAKRDFSNVIHLDRNFSLAYNRRAYCKLKLGEYSESLEDYNYLIQKLPTVEMEVCSALSGRCMAKKHLRLEQEAYNDYEQAQMHELTSEFSYFVRAEAHELFQNHKAAVVDYEKTLKINPDYTPANTALQKLRSKALQEQDSSSLLNEIRMNYRSTKPNAQEILAKFAQLLNDYPNDHEKILLSRAEFNLYIADTAINTTQKEFILRNAQNDYSAIMQINCYNKEAAIGLAEVDRSLQQIGATTSRPSLVQLG